MLRNWTANLHHLQEIRVILPELTGKCHNTLILHAGPQVNARNIEYPL